MRYWHLRFAQAACGAFVLLLASAVFAATVLEEGKVAYEAGDYATAIEKWQAAITEGRPEGLFFLGVMHAEGKGFDKDHAKAFEYYKQAAEKDFVPAQYNLGNQYATGEGVGQDYSKAEYWWGKAADSGLVHAQVNLGNLYYYGATGEKKPALARKWLTLATRQGYGPARETLAKLDAEEGRTVSARKVNAEAPIVARPSSDALRREAWVLAQPPGFFTIQILATGTDILAREHIKQYELSSTAAYIESVAQGAAVFRIIYGSYSSREQADKALAALPRAIAASSPWVRTFAEMHKLVDRRYVERGAP